MAIKKKKVRKKENFSQKYKKFFVSLFNFEVWSLEKPSYSPSLTVEWSCKHRKIYAVRDTINLFLQLGSRPVLILSQCVLQVNPCSGAETPKGEWQEWRKLRSKDTFSASFCGYHNICRPFFILIYHPYCAKTKWEKKLCLLFCYGMI